MFSNVKVKLSKFFDLLCIGIRYDFYCNDGNKALEFSTETISSKDNQCDVLLS